jgi:ribose 5-phosphate isomerase B
VIRIAIGADHAGFKVKEALKAALQNLGHTVLDLGTDSEDSTDYPDYARKVAELVSRGEAERGVLVCGTGIGMSMAANKVRGVRAAVVTSEETARLSRAHNDANVFCAGARVTDEATLERALRAWLETPFEGGRHERRVAKIDDLDGA